MTNEDLKLLEKFKNIFSANLTEDEALSFWSGLSAEEYDRLIYLFGQNKPEGISGNISVELVEIFKKLKFKLLELKKPQKQES